MFNRQGRDGLTYDEVRRALERVNIDCTDTQFTKLMTEIDADGDGNVTHQEFLSYMKESERKSFKEEAVGVAGVPRGGRAEPRQPLHMDFLKAGEIVCVGDRIGAKTLS